MKPTCKSTDLGQLQTEAEKAAKELKAARAATATAKANEARKEEAYAVAQKALAIGVDQVKNSTKA